MTKKCNQCKKTKNVSDFYKRGDGTNGYKYICKLCDNITANIRRKENGYKYDHSREAIGSKHHKLSKINSQKHRDTMSDMYMRSLIAKKWPGMKPQDIPDELVELYRINLKLKRELKLTHTLKPIK